MRCIKTTEESIHILADTQVCCSSFYLYSHLNCDDSYLANVFFYSQISLLPCQCSLKDTDIVRLLFQWGDKAIFLTSPVKKPQKTLFATGAAGDLITSFPVLPLLETVMNTAAFRDCSRHASSWRWPSPFRSQFLLQSRGQQGWGVHQKTPAVSVDAGLLSSVAAEEPHRAIARHYYPLLQSLSFLCSNGVTNRTKLRVEL